MINVLVFWLPSVNIYKKRERKREGEREKCEWMSGGRECLGREDGRKEKDRRTFQASYIFCFYHKLF